MYGFFNWMCDIGSLWRVMHQILTKMLTYCLRFALMFAVSWYISCLLENLCSPRINLRWIFQKIAKILKKYYYQFYLTLILYGGTTKSSVNCHFHLFINCRLFLIVQLYFIRNFRKISKNGRHVAISNSYVWFFLTSKNKKSARKRL